MPKQVELDRCQADGAWPDDEARPHARAGHGAFHQRRDEIRARHEGRCRVHLGQHDPEPSPKPLFGQGLVDGAEPIALWGNEDMPGGGEGRRVAEAFGGMRAGPGDAHEVLAEQGPGQDARLGSGRDADRRTWHLEDLFGLFSQAGAFPALPGETA